MTRSNAARWVAARLVRGHRRQAPDWNDEEARRRSPPAGQRRLKRWAARKALGQSCELLRIPTVAIAAVATIRASRRPLPWASATSAKTGRPR